MTALIAGVIALLWSEPHTNQHADARANGDG
jgi:hypothetical protein